MDLCAYMGGEVCIRECQKDVTTALFYNQMPGKTSLSYREELAYVIRVNSFMPGVFICIQVANWNESIDRTGRSE